MDRPDLAERSDLSIRPPPSLRLLPLLFVTTGDAGEEDDDERRRADEPPSPDRVVDDGGIATPPPPAPLVRVALAPRRALEAGDFADPPSSAFDSFGVLLLADVDDRPVNLLIILACARLFVIFLGIFVNMMICLQHTRRIVIIDRPSHLMSC